MASILDYLDASADRSPEAAALGDGEHTITFRELRESAYGFADVLLDMGVSGPVGIYAQRTADVITAMLGIAAAGCCYVPLNPDAPASKTDKLLAHAEASLVIGFQDGEYHPEGCAYMRFSDVSISPTHIRPNVTITERDTLYIIYTSGSTGEPKGIRKSHGSVMNFIEAYVPALKFDCSEVLGNQTPFCFDASAKDIYLMLKTGARMEIIPSAMFSFPVRLIEYLNTRGITFISWVPSALAIVARLRTFRDILPATLKRVCFVGEVFPVKDLEVWRAALPEAEFINLYGQSELAGVCCMYPVPKEGPCPAMLPMGKPLSNSRIWLYENGKISPDHGELLIESGALADEYIHDPEKTAKTFIELTIDGQKRRLLRSGDFGRYDENGDLVFMSRADGQIKYKGYRIELGEIEAAVSELDFLDRSCVLYNAERERITLFCTTFRPDLKLKDVTEALEGRLADYMLPRKLIVLEKMPLNSNGKIDRPYLKTML